MESLKKSVGREIIRNKRRTRRDIKKAVKAKPRNKVKLDTSGALETTLAPISQHIQVSLKEFDEI